MPSSKPPKAACVEDFDTDKQQAVPRTAQYADKGHSLLSQTTSSTFSDSGYSSHTNPTTLSGSPGAQDIAPPSLGLNKTASRGESKSSRPARPQSPLRRTSSRASKHVDCDCALCKRAKPSPLDTTLDTNYPPFTQPSPRLNRTTSASQQRMPPRPELFSAASMGPPPRPASRHASSAPRPMTYHEQAYAEPRFSAYPPVSAYNTPVSTQSYYIYPPSRPAVPLTPSSQTTFYPEWANYSAAPAASYDRPSSSRRTSMHVSKEDYEYYGIVNPPLASPKKPSRHSSYGDTYKLERSTTAPVHHGPTRPPPPPEPVRRAETPKHSRKSSGREGRRTEVSVGSTETVRRAVSRRRTSHIEEAEQALAEREKRVAARERELARKEAERDRENRARQKHIIQQLEAEAAQGGRRVKEAFVSSWVTKIPKGRKSSDKKDKR